MGSLGSGTKSVKDLQVLQHLQMFMHIDYICILQTDH